MAAYPIRFQQVSVAKKHIGLSTPQLAARAKSEPSRICHMCKGARASDFYMYVPYVVHVSTLCSLAKKLRDAISRSVSYMA
eukprot:1507-Rhodomonas_salina.2